MKIFSDRISWVIIVLLAIASVLTLLFGFWTLHNN